MFFKFTLISIISLILHFDNLSRCDVAKSYDIITITFPVSISYFTVTYLYEMKYKVYFFPCTDRSMTPKLQRISPRP